MYYGSVGNNNLCVRGNVSTTLNPPSACGAYNAMWGICGCWGYSSILTNDSVQLWSDTAKEPKLNTGQSSNNFAFGTGYRNKDRLFHFNLTQISGTNTIGYTSPFAASTQGSLLQAYKCQTMSNTQTFITITAAGVYPNTFAGWRLNNASGTFLTLTATTNWFYNGTYGGSNMSNIKQLYAQAIS